ncbi:MAG: hypothetical protein JWP10_987 [Nocardioidaceae bacterium]|nr:hypothetical protein [Nocardioidaceae bacterium]
MEPWEIEARQCVQLLISRYTRYVDAGKAGDLANLFTEDCVYDMGGGNVAEGRAAIVPTVEGLKTMFSTTENFGRIRHHTSSVWIDIEGPDRAKAMSYYFAMAAHGPDHWGVYRDVIVRTDAGWQFEKRVVTVDGSVAISPVRHLVPEA